MLTRGCQLQYSPENPSAKIVVSGDSHSRSWVRPLLKIAKRMRYDLTILSYVGCPPLRGIRRDDTGDKGHCDTIDHTNKFFDVIADLKPDVVVLAARWPMYVHGYRDSNYGYLSSMTHLLSPDMVRPPTEATSLEALQVRAPETIRFLHDKGIGVVLIKSPPQMLFSWNGRRAGPRGGEPTLEQHRNYTREIDKVFDSIPGVVLIDPSEKLCQSGTCLESNDSTRFYYDDNHLTSEGADLFEEDLLRGLSKASNR